MKERTLLVPRNIGEGAIDNQRSTAGVDARGLYP